MVLLGFERRRLDCGPLGVSVEGGWASVLEKKEMACCRGVFWLLALCGTLYGRLGIG